jgi:hypothetical protein
MNGEPRNCVGRETRRVFLKQAASVAVAIGASDFSATSARAQTPPPASSPTLPWYRRALRWGQTNITERDPARYDVAWWRQYWKHTQVQGVIINAGGIVAYYPSRYPLHRRAEFLGDRDLFGDLVRAAHEDGLAVLARMDSNRAHEEFYRAHPDWFAVDPSGKPFRAGELFVACIHGPYYEEWIPDLLREIAERYQPEGFTDNSWSGLGRGSICHCDHCRRSFRQRTGRNLPSEKNWDDPVWREWVQWNYARRLEIWDFYNRVARAVANGSSDCQWVGMNSGSISSQGASFRDLKEICARAQIILLDHQARSDAGGFQQNGETGKLIHGLLGWGKLAPESMALYQAGKPTFRLSAKPAPEARMWMLDGFAGGIQPWWHHIGAYHEDRRAYQTVEPVMRWHRMNEAFLVNRQPIATVGVVWSQANTDFYGRDDAEVLVEQPWRGVTQALIRARIPYLPVHADQIQRDASDLSLLILPNLAAITDAQIASVRDFVEHGGGLVATGETSLCNEWGDARADFGLADLLGAHAVEKRAATNDASRRRQANETQHTYLRLTPELNQPSAAGDQPAPAEGARKRADPGTPGETPALLLRHPVLRSFEDTDILPFGGVIEESLKVESSATVPLTFVPAFPIYPPETAWMRKPRTDIPGLILNERPGHGRVAFLPADLDRRFARDNLPDHGDLLANLVRWAARDRIPLVVEGAGLLDCHLYRQADRLILHLVNLTNPGAWRAPVHELIPVGPWSIRAKLPDGVAGRKLRLLVSGAKVSATVRNGWSRFAIKSVLDHEVILIQ